MEHSYSLSDLIWYLMIYSFLGWSIEVLIFTLVNGRFVNRGLLNLPVALPYGITAVIAMLALPGLDGNAFAQYILLGLIFRMVWALSNHFVRRISGAEPDRHPWKHYQAILITCGIALVFLVQYLLIHPFLMTIFTLLPRLVRNICAWLFAALVVIDFFCVRHALRSPRPSMTAQLHLQGTQALADRMTNSIRTRLQKAYPGIHDPEPKEYIFAKGLCFDKLWWVFLVSSVLGAGIEMVFCRVKGGVWMNRSSLLYGPFSVVWGLGAVLLTLVLQRLEDKPDRHIFVAGCFFGGVYEYLCSVFTEYVFGTVFWDYSSMPLNLGGRINLLYCIFWGILAVLWLRVLYPPMERGIEKLPPLAGKIITWLLILLMCCNALLTSAAMLRYTDRQTEPTADNIIEAFLDERFPDDYMEQRWPNMMLTE